MQIDGAVPSHWDVTDVGRTALTEAASTIGPGSGALEFVDAHRRFRFTLLLPVELRRPDDITRASREGLQSAVATLGLLGTSLVWRTFDAISAPDDFP